MQCCFSRENVFRKRSALRLDSARFDDFLASVGLTKCFVFGVRRSLSVRVTVGAGEKCVDRQRSGSARVLPRQKRKRHADPFLCTNSAVSGCQDLARAFAQEIPAIISRVPTLVHVKNKNCHRVPFFTSRPFLHV